MGHRDRRARLDRAGTPELDLRGLEDEELDLIGREGQRVIQTLKKSLFHDAHFGGGIAERIRNALVCDGGCIIPELHRDKRAREEEVEQLIVLDPILPHEPVRIQHHRDEHMARELVQLEKIEQNGEELVQGVLQGRDGMGRNILAVIVLYPGYTDLKQDLACEGSVWVEFDVFHYFFDYTSKKAGKEDLLKNIQKDEGKQSMNKEVASSN